MPLAELDDATLVARSRAGEREAFGVIVARYQSLVCSLAFSATGGLATSEDLAQETFLEAWKHLPELREPGNVRAWLCGIVRNRIRNARRAGGREPSHQAESLDAAARVPTEGISPAGEAVRQDEAELIWRAVREIPEIYREPLLLFYREQQSIALVAEALEISEVLVRQRLSRGRQLLHDEVSGLIEGALVRTKPGTTFTRSVLSALPTLTATQIAAGAKTLKGFGVLKALGGGALSGFIGPLLGWWVPAQLEIEFADTEEERQRAKKKARITFVYVLLFCAAVFLYEKFIPTGWRIKHPLVCTFGLVGLGGLFAIPQIVEYAIWWRRQFRRPGLLEATPPRSEERAKDKIWLFRRWTYRSKSKFLGLPLIVVNANRRATDGFSPAIGWIAIGDVAIGGLFAAGGIAIAPISTAGVALGGLVFAGAALGGIAVGGGAIGYIALGGGAIAWHAAIGGLAVARHFALGGGAYATHANDDAAMSYLHGTAIQHLVERWQMPIFAFQGTMVVGWLAVILWLRWKRLRTTSTSA